MKKKLIILGIIAVAVVGVVGYVKTSNAYIFNPIGNSSSSGVATGTVLSLGSPLTIQGNSTATIAGAGGVTSYIPIMDSVYHLPSPTQLTAGVRCGASNGVTDVGACINADYLEGSANGSTTEIIAGPYKYSYSTPIVFGVQAELVYLHGSGGNGTLFNFTPTSGTALTLNDCNSNAKRQALQLAHFALSGATTTLAATDGVFFGGTNGACASVADDLTIRTFGIGAETGANTYMFGFYDSLISNVSQAFKVDGFNNSGEQFSIDRNRFVDPAGASPSSTQYVLISAGGWTSGEMCGNSIDNGGVQVGGGSFDILFCGNHMENPSLGSSYTYLDILSSLTTTMNITGNVFMNDATALANTPMGGIAFGNCGAVCNITGNAFDRNGSATSTTYGFTNSNNTNTSKLTACNNNNIGSMWQTAVIAAGGVADATNNGCLYDVNNNYLQGIEYLPANKIEYFTGSAGVGVSVTGNIGGSATGVSTAFANSGSFTQGSSTVDVIGTLGRAVTTITVSSTLGNMSGITTPIVFLNSAGAGTLTMNGATSTQDRDDTIKVIGAGTWTIAASGTDCFRAAGSTATSTTLTLTAGSSTELVDSGNLCGGAGTGGVWDGLWVR